MPKYMIEKAENLKEYRQFLETFCSSASSLATNWDRVAYCITERSSGHLFFKEYSVVGFLKLQTPVSVSSLRIFKFSILI